VPRLRHTTSECAEHTFGNLRQMIREFTVHEFVQLAAKLISRLNLMYKNSFGPSNCPQKGYSSTYHDFYHYGLDRNSEGCMRGTINVQNGDGYVAEQLWETVSNLITFSSDSMRKLLVAVGVSTDEMSPFCRTFSSLVDLRDEFIHYLPRTFVYQNVQGHSAVEESESGGDDDDGDNSDDDKVTQRIVERIKLFTAGMANDDEEEVVVVDDEEEVVVVDEVPLAKDSDVSPSSDNATLTSVNTAEQLMTRFRSIFETTGGLSEILEHVICASSCLANSEHTPGSISPNRKAKSLVQRWVAKPIDGVVKDGAELVGIEDILIERDMIILLNVEYGTGAAATVVQRQFRVLEIYEKYYNKWSVSPAAAKKWKNEKKPFKMMVRMLKKNAVDEYSDEEMYGTGFNKDEYARMWKTNILLEWWENCMQ